MSEVQFGSTFDWTLIMCPPYLLAGRTRAKGRDGEFVRRRLRLPARERGGAVRSHVETADAAFVGTMNRALTVLIDHTTADGTVVTSYFQVLEGALGAGSFDVHAPARSRDVPRRCAAQSQARRSTGQTASARDKYGVELARLALVGDG